MLRSAFLAVAMTALAVYSAGAAPMISVNESVVINPESEVVPPGGSWSHTVIVTNTGDSPLTISRIGTYENTWFGYAPRGWLSASDTELYVLPGAENAAQLEIRMDASAFRILGNLVGFWFLPTIPIGYVYLNSDAANDDSLTIFCQLYLSAPDTTVLWGVLGTNSDIYELGVDLHEICVGLAGSSGGAFWSAGLARDAS